MTEQPKDGGAAFDLAQMIADREAGTPGLWFVAGVRVKMDEQQWIAISRYDEASKRDENICCAGYDPKTGLGSTDARRISRVPLLEAEIIRLTARVERLEGALNGMLQSVCGPTGFAEAVRHNSGHAYPWHSLDDAEAKARAALSTHTEDQPK